MSFHLVLKAIGKNNALECEECKAERKRRVLVARGPGDERFHDADFLEAKSIFANNDVKYDVVI